MKNEISDEDAGKRSTKERILAAAAELFAEKGYFAVPVRTIARRVGIKESSLYHHFTNKEDILEKIFDAFNRALQSYFDTANSSLECKRASADHHTPDILWRELQRYRDYWNEPVRERLWYIVSMEKYRNTRAAEMVLELTGNFRGLYEHCFRQWKDAKIMESREPAGLAAEYTYSILGMHTEYRLLRAVSRSTRGLEGQMHEYIRSFFKRELMREKK